MSEKLRPLAPQDELALRKILWPDYDIYIINIIHIPTHICIDVLRLDHKFFSHVGTFSSFPGLVEPVLGRGPNILLKDTMQCLY